MTIRSYGPGKFDTILDSFVYSMSLDGGADEEIGESESFGWYGLLRGPFTDEDVDRLNEIAAEQKDDPLTDEEEEMLLGSKGGAIMSEVSTGLVHIEYFDTEKGAKDAWEEVAAEYEKFEEEAEGEGEDEG